jgi:ketosteroid isomerase-like protein
MPITVSEGGEWIERLAIADLIYRYSDSVTRADWDQTEAVFAPDAVWESPALGLRFEGARKYRDFLAETTGNDLLIQTSHQPVIRFVGLHQAVATTTVQELVRGKVHADSALGEAGTPVNLEQYGIYHDDLAKFDEEWKFTHRLFVPVYVRTDSVTGQVLTPRFALSRPTSV